MQRLVLPLVLLSAAASQARAQEPWSTDAETVARDLFFRGVKLLEAGDTEMALDAFLRSRAALPRKGNTLDAAICLERMGRFDEALALYEEVLAKYSSEMAEPDRSSVMRAVNSLRQIMGTLEISASVSDGSVQIDGAPRGTLPLNVPLHVTAGDHEVRVVKNGYEPFSTRLHVVAGETVRIDARLQPLTKTGVLRVEGASGARGEVFVDSALVGEAPWEGQLAPGRHVVWLRHAEVGSRPTSLVVVAGQVSLARLELLPLGPVATIHAEPATTEILVDDVVVGVGSFQSRLVRGEHRVTVREPGYFSETRVIEPRDGPENLTFSLRVDASHPRWPQTASARFWIGAFGSYAIGNSLGSGVEDCRLDCVSNPVVQGGLAIGRLGVRFPIGVSLEAGGGWLGLSKDVFRFANDHFGAGGRYSVRYDLEDQLGVSGPVLQLGVSYVIPVVWRLDAVARISGGVLFARATDGLNATAQAGGVTVAAGDFGPARDVTATVPVVTPELGAELRFGNARLGLNLGVAFLPIHGPYYPERTVGTSTPPDPNNEGAVGNAPQSDIVGPERSFGATMIWLPGLSFRYEL